MIRRKTVVAGFALISLIASLRAGDEGVHIPAAGSPERDGVLAALHAEFTTGSGSAVKFKVNYFKVHDGWAWINVTPLAPSGKIGGEDWPSLLEQKNGKWAIVDLIKIAQETDDPVGPVDPSLKFLYEARKRYPGIPSDILLFSWAGCGW